MPGFEILKARRKSGVSQSELIKAMSFRGGRGGLTDIENGNIEVTARWAAKAIKVIEEIARKKLS